jgi:gliding motility-associated-like protein
LAQSLNYLLIKYIPMRNKNYKRILNYSIILLVGLITQFSFAQQNILISQGGSVAVANGDNFYDAGGAAGNDGNTSYTITLTPPAGQSVCVDFTSFNSYESLDIFDGTTVAATNIGSLKGNYGTAYNAAGAPYNTGQPALGGVVQAELKPGIFCANNATGALTFRFTNAGASQSTGWVGSIITYAKPTTGCNITISAAPTTICLGASTTLTATGTIGSALINNDFNASSLGAGWSATPGGVAFVNVLGCQPNYGYNTQNTDTSIFAWMQNVAAPRTLESNGFDVSNGGVLSFDFREASDDNGGNGCEALDDKEGVYIQYSTNNGTTWNNMKLMFASVESNFPSAANIGCGTYVYNWNTTTVPIPAVAMTANTKFRWYQNSSTTASQDSWGIDNVKIIKNVTSTITITDLLTNTVVATSNTTSAIVSVFPASTRTYRATISDGITSCSNDVTITVNGGTPTTINYAGSPFVPSAGASNVTVTNGPVSGSYTATPAGLTINAASGQITPSTSTPGTYTVSVSTSCGTATATVVIASSTCATCATASCAVISLTTSTAALGQTGITTNLGVAGDQLGNAPLVPGQSITICVPVIVVTGSTILGFKQLTSSSPGGCGSPLEEVITYQLTNTACGATIAPNRTNASAVASGFNPEWDGLTAGNYVLCFTMNITASAICTSVDLQGLGYYNVVPVCSNPVISSQPLATQTLCKNSVVTNLSITATGTALTYQWYSNTSNSNVGGTLIPSATATTYTPSTSTVGTFYFYCVVTSGTCTTTSTVSTVIVNNSIVPTYTKTVTACSTGSISFSSILPAGTTFNWLSGPSGYVFPAGFQTALTTNTSLSALPAGTYCVDITSPTSLGSTVTSTLFTETFEAGLANWTLDNTNGPNIFVLNNQYVGGSCVTGLGTFTVPAVPNEPVAVTAGPNSNYLHIKATTTTGAVCGGGSVNFIPLNANFDGQISDQKATLNTVINTIGKTNVRFNFYWLAQGETNASGSDDYGSIEYSINGGVSWILSGAKLRRQTTWLSDFRTDPLWDNQANLRFRIRWNNDASSSIDPPISIDEIIITADSTSVASCGSTVNECIVISATPVVPTVTTVSATCLANGTASVSNYSAGLIYTSNPVGLSVSATGVVSGFTCGVPYTITATNVATCFATSASFTVGCQLVAPVVPTVVTAAATCLANGTASVSNYSGALIYTSNPVGLSVSATGVVSGFTCGTPYTITATNASTCASTSFSFTVGCQLLAPVVPTVTTVAATCLANGTASVSNYSGALIYTSNPVGLSVSATGVVSGFTCGTPYTITATNVATCFATSASFTVGCQLVAPVVPTVVTVPATCLANGTASVSNYSGALIYTSNPVGLSVSATGVISGFTCGTPYTITATNAATCFATSASFTVGCQLLAPVVPTVTTVAATCLANGTASVSNYSGALIYTSNPVGLSVSATGVVSGFTCGTPYTITATNVATCFATSASFTVGCQLVAPVVPTVVTVPATCLANGTASVSNYSGALIYTSNPVGLSVSATGVISGFTCGTPYTITATNAATCFATSASFTVGCQLVAPVVPTVTTVAATCSANGTASVSNYSAGLTYTSNPVGLSVSATGAVSGFTCGTPYTITGTNVATCFATSTSFTVGCQLVAPVVPTVTTVAATCSANGTASVSNYSAGLTYTSNPSGLSVSATGVVSGFTCGVPYTITATNAATCFATSASFTVGCQLVAPVVPTVTTAAATCSANGTASVSNYSAGLTYTSNPVGLSVSATGVVSGFTCGNSYTITATNASTCASTSFSFTVGCQLVAPIVPTAIITQPTCAVNSGTITVTSPVAGSGITYTIVGTLPVVSAITNSTGAFSGLASGNYNVSTTVNGCTSPVASLIINAQPLTPIFSLQDDIICSNDTVGKRLDTGLNSTYTYVWEKDGVVISNALPYLDVTQPGLYKVTVSDASICTVSDSAVISASMTPEITSLTASSYFEDVTFITVNVTPLSNDYEYALDNGAFQDENTFYNIPRGSYTVTVRNKRGCGEDSSLISIVNYPHYFTPNGDGYHETWNILDLENQIASKIYIFDRFGKLIKEIRPSGTGWDGTFNGQPLPSTDYWFVVYYDENGVSKEFRAHFSLKR